MTDSVHFQDRDPGTRWIKDDSLAIDSDGPLDSARTLTPNVVRVKGGYRLYYHGFGPGRPNEESSGYILSAFSEDAETWQKEEGVRIDAGGEFAADCIWGPDVVSLSSGEYRMYFEGRTNQNDGRVKSVILSAVSTDGINWQQETGTRLMGEILSYGAPRCISIESDGSRQEGGNRFRLYASASPLCQDYFTRDGSYTNCNIISAVSKDGITFELEPGVRVIQDHDLESYSVYAPEVVRLGVGGYRMYYAGWTAAPEVPAGSPYHGRIFSAWSADGIAWQKDPEICIDNGGKWDRAKASEPCVIDLPDGRFRMFYEACDYLGQWRIASATSVL